MKFYMDVTEQGVNIQHRTYDKASDCTNAMKIAENFYTQKAQHVEIIMTDENEIIIARLEVKP